MNSEKELINRIKNLKEIKPDKEWVISCKARIMGQSAARQESPFIILAKNFVFQYRAALAGLVLMIGATGGMLAVAQTALPGEPLYGLKKIAEKSIAAVMGQDDRATANLRLAAKRLEEIDIISQKNLVQNLPAAFYEYKIAKTAAKKEVAELVKSNPDRAGEIAKEAALAMKDIDSRERQVYAVLGLEQVVSAAADSSEAAEDKKIIESLIIYFNGNELLSEEQAADLNRVRDLYSAGDYTRAVDYYLSSSLNR